MKVKEAKEVLIRIKFYLIDATEDNQMNILNSFVNLIEIVKFW